MYPLDFSVIAISNFLYNTINIMIRIEKTQILLQFYYKVTILVFSS